MVRLLLQCLDDWLMERKMLLFFRFKFMHQGAILKLAIYIVLLEGNVNACISVAVWHIFCFSHILDKMLVVHHSVFNLLLLGDHCMHMH